MKTIEKTAPFRVVGMELRTSNEHAFEDIPLHWQRFYERGGPATIPGRLNDDQFAVYTKFEREGVDNSGEYSLIIGTMVAPDGTVPPGLVEAQIPGGRRAVFPVNSGHPEQVGEVWRHIWQLNELAKCYVCDYERYQADGRIDIFVGIR